MKLTFSLFLCILFVPFLQAQKQSQLSFRDLTVEDGLSQNSVVSITQDSIGYLWFATQDGLNKYDGNSFKYYNKQYQDITRSNYAQLGQIYNDNRGDLWSYSSTEIIEKYNYTSQQFDSIASVANATVLFRKSQNELWVGTLNNGLVSVDFEHKTVRSLFENELKNTSVFEIKLINHLVYLGTSEGVFSVEGNTISQIPLTNDYAVSSIIKNESTIVFGTYGNGVKTIDLKSNTLLINKPNNLSDNLNVQDVFLDSKQRLWIATYGDGLYLITSDGKVSNYKANKENPFAIHYNDILKVYEDLTGNIWFGSDGAGLSYYDEHLVKFKSITSKQVPENIHVDVVRAIAVDSSGIMWLGTSGKGLTKINEAKALYKTYTEQNSNLASNRVMSLLFVDNDLWIGHQSKGLQILNTQGQFISFPELNNHAIWKIYRDSKNNMWLCTRTSGLLKFDISKGVIEHYDKDDSGLTTNNIRTIEEDFNNDLWIGTDDNGLFKLDMTSKQIEKINIVQDKIKSLHHADSLLWIGTNGNGIKSLNIREHKVNDYFFNDIMANKVIYGLLSDDNNNLWVSTNKGISRFSPHHPNRKFVENYSIVNGVQAYEFNTGAYFKSSSGNLYFGGIEGINWFNPEGITYNEIKPKTIISKFEVFGKEQPMINGEKLNYKQNTVTFTFAGLHFSYPENNLYRYKLVNHDEEWTTPSHEYVAHYTNLPPNDYEFKVTSSNYEGVWNKESAVYTFTILKPWYATNLALFIYLLLILLSIYAIYKYFKFKWEVKTQLQLEHAETERLKKLDEFKTKLYTNISHEIRTPLTLISGPVENQLDKKDLSESDRQDLTLVQQNAKRIINLVNQMMDLSLIDSGQLKLKVEKGNLGILLKQIVEAFKYKAQKDKLEIIAKIDTLNNVFFDKDIIEKATTNLLANAIKYAPKNNAIFLEATLQDKSVVISVLNEVNKVNQKDLSKLFKRFYQNDEASDGVGVGLALVKELVSLTRGTILANNIDNNKIQFNITIPITKDAFEIYEIIEENETDASVTDTESNNKQAILVVEDGQEIREFIISILESDYNIIAANNGQIGIDEAKKHLPDLIISDIMMPVLDGLALCQAIKEDTYTSHIPVILLTAKAGEENEIQGLKTGADEYMTKPFSAKHLKVKVVQLLKNRTHLKELYSSEFTINPELGITSTEENFLKQLQEILEKDITNPNFKSETLAKSIHLSRTQLHRKLKAIYGLTTSEFIRTQRLKIAAKLLQTSDATVAEIAYQVGFNSPSYFIKSFKEVYNTTPSNFQKGL